MIVPISLPLHTVTADSAKVLHNREHPSAHSKLCLSIPKICFTDASLLAGYGIARQMFPSIGEILIEYIPDSIFHCLAAIVTLLHEAGTLCSWYSKVGSTF
jgi:hypothetical protein